jgi:hypothetical protein
MKINAQSRSRLDKLIITRSGLNTSGVIGIENGNRAGKWVWRLQKGFLSDSCARGHKVDVSFEQLAVSYWRLMDGD